MASGVLPKLRQAYGGARIDWLVQEECAGLLQAAPDLDHVVVWPRRSWEKGLKRGRLAGVLGQARELVGRLRSADYDLVLDLQGLWKSGIWAWLSRGAWRVGLDSREGSGMVMSTVVKSTKGDKRIASEYKTLLESLPLVDAHGYALGLEPNGKDRAFVHRLLASHGVAPGRYFLLCPFTTRPQKHWVDARWVELGEVLYRRFRLPSVLAGGPGDRDKAGWMAGRFSTPVVNLAGRTSLSQGLALVQSAGLVIGVDTGLTHMGVMSPVPAMALFGSTCPYMQVDSDRALVLYDKQPCSPCKRNPTCGGEFKCMQALSVEAVLEGASRLLGAGCP